jgi:polyvinyl alcohol dehydrogenase (cytochrome)
METLMNPRHRLRTHLLLGVFLASAILSIFASAAQGKTPSNRSATSLASPSATYDGGISRTGYVNDSLINPANVGQLKEKWRISESAPLSGQPIVDDGVIYWGGWNGDMHATTLSGKNLWTVSLGQTSRPPRCVYALSTLGILSSATIGTINGTKVVWVGGGAGQLVALDASTGRTIWTRHLSTEPSASIWSSPAYYHGSLYIGVASWQGCPNEFGRIVRVNAATGQLQNAINFSSILPARCAGPGAWSSPAVDVGENAIFIGTSNDLCGSKYQDAILKLNPRSLAMESLWQVPITQHPADSDFGATPMLFSATIGGVQQQLVGAENKNGVYYVLDRTNLAAGPVWQYRIESSAALADASCNNSISTSAWAGAGQPIMVAGISLKGSTCIGTMTALDPATGQPEWQVNLQGGVEGAVTELPGLVVVGAGRDLDVLSSASGATLFSYTEPVPTKGDSGVYGAPKYWFWAPPTVTGGTILAENQDGTLQAFGT